MNKNLEKEYKKLMTESAPDLWERIEAGLEPKQPTAKKGDIWKRYRTWGFAVAACLCVMVTIPVILRKNTDESSRSGNTPAYDADMADGSLSMADGNPSMADGNLGMVDGNPSMADSNPSMADSNPSMADGNPSMADGNPSMADGSPSMADGNLNAAENDGALFEAPSTEDTVATNTIMGTVTEISEEEGRSVYIVDIFRTDLAELSEGDAIRLYSDWDFSEEIFEGEEYLFDIAVFIDNTGERKYLIESIW